MIIINNNNNNIYKYNVGLCWGVLSTAHFVMWSVVNSFRPWVRSSSSKSEPLGLRWSATWAVAPWVVSLIFACHLTRSQPGDSASWERPWWCPRCSFCSFIVSERPILVGRIRRKEPEVWWWYEGCTNIYHCEDFGWVGGANILHMDLLGLGHEVLSSKFQGCTHGPRLDIQSVFTNQVWPWKHPRLPGKETLQFESRVNI
jgi:hypothetical protein